jgi:hypothetical protein
VINNSGTDSKGARAQAGGPHPVPPSAPAPGSKAVEPAHPSYGAAAISYCSFSPFTPKAFDIIVVQYDDFAGYYNKGAYTSAGL